MLNFIKTLESFILLCYIYIYIIEYEILEMVSKPIANHMEELGYLEVILKCLIFFHISPNISNSNQSFKLQTNESI